MDTPFPTEPLSIPEFVPPEPDAAPVEPPKDEGASTLGVLGRFTGITGLSTLLQEGQRLGQEAVTNPDVFKEDQDRSFVGHGETEKFPIPQNVDILRKNQGNPDAIEAFDYMFGQGASQRYLRYASDQDVKTLLKNRDNPEAIDAFDALYGPNSSRYYIPLFDPKSSAPDKLRAGLELKRIMQQGSNATDSVENSRLGQYTGSLVKGLEAAGQELVQSVGSLTGSKTIQDAATNLERPDTRLVDDPLISGAITGVSQFAAGFAILNGIVPGAGVVADLPKLAKGAAHFVRALGVGALTDAFAFDPHDPMLGDMAKVIEQKTGYKVMPDVLRDYLTVDKHDSEADNRLKHAIEGAGLSVGVEVLVGLAKAARFAMKGDKEAAKATADAVADKLETTDWSQITNDTPAGKNDSVKAALQERSLERTASDPVYNERQADRLLHEEPAQPELPLEGGGARPDEQFSFDRQLKFGEDNPHVDIGQRMDLPAETKPGQIDWLANQQAAKAGEADAMEQAIREKWSPPDPQASFDLPPGTRDFGDARLPGRPGDQLPFDFERGQGHGAAEDVVTREDLVRANAAEAEREAMTPGPWQRRQAIMASQNLDEVIREAVDNVPTEVRDVVHAVKGEPAPIRTDVDNPIRKLVDAIPDFKDTSLAEKDSVLRPFVDRWLDLVRQHSEGLIDGLAGAFSPREIEKLYPLLKLAASEAKQQADTLSAEVRSLMKNGRGAEAERLRTTDLASAQELASQAGRLAQETGAVSGRLLQSHKIADEIVRSPATRAQIDKLRANGMSDQEIANLVRQGVDNLKIDTTKLADLAAEVRRAREAGDEAAAVAAEKKLAAETDRVAREAERASTNWWKEVWRHLLDAKLSLMFYGPKTVAIAQIIPNTLNIASRGLAELYGQWRVRMPTSGAFQAMKESYLISASKYYGMRSGYESQLAALAQIGKDSVETFKTGKSKISGEDRINEGNRRAQPFTSSYYNLEGAPAKAMDAFGTALHLPFKLMALSDEAMGTVVARAEIAAEATMNHLDKIAERKDAIKTVLKDKTLSPAERTKLRAELDNLNAGKVEIDGKLVSRKEYIDDEVAKRFDANGVLTDEAVAKMADHVLLKDAFESGPGKALEKLLAEMPALKATVFPIFRTPFRAIQGGFELIPIFNRLPGFSSFSADLAGKNGIRAQAIAKGRAMQGWAVTSFVLWKWLDGEITGPGPSNYEERKQMEASGWRANHIKIGGKWFDYALIDPIGTVLKVTTSILQSYELEMLRATPDQTKLDLAADMMKASAMAVATAVMDNSMLTGMRNIVQLSQAATSDNPDDAKTSAVAQKFAAQQAQSLVPQLLRATNDVMDPRMVDVLNVVDVYHNATFGRDQMAKQYDPLGQPRTLDKPERSFIGFLSPVSGKEMNREQFVLKTLDNLTLLTGSRFTFNPKPPGSTVGDLRNIQAVSGPDRLSDIFAKHFRTVEVGGATLEDTLYAYVSSQAENKTRSIGQYRAPGAMVKEIKAIMDAYRKAAWALTQKDEEQNTAFTELQRKARELKADSFDPSKDKSVPDRLNQDFTLK